MATTDCCQLIDDIRLDLDGCVISISVSSNTETYDLCNEVLAGPTIGTISLSAYARNSIYVGCPSKAGVSIQWLRKYDCDNDNLYFIKSGQGQSFISGETEGLARIKSSLNRTYPTINASASASSGPTALYIKTDREDGYGLVYTGDPFEFDTDSDLVFSNFGVGSGPLYLQSFNLDLTPGSLPVASYSFLFFIND